VCAKALTRVPLNIKYVVMATVDPRDMSKAELQGICRHSGVSSAGTKAQLAVRAAGLKEQVPASFAKLVPDMHLEALFDGDWYRVCVRDIDAAKGVLLYYLETDEEEWLLPGDVVGSLRATGSRCGDCKEFEWEHIWGDGWYGACYGGKCEPCHVAVLAQEEAQSAEQIDDIACEVCAKFDDEELMVLCDHCDCGYHVYCLEPKLPAIPDGDWSCVRCQPTPTPVSESADPVVSVEEPVESTQVDCSACNGAHRSHTCGKASVADKMQTNRQKVEESKVPTLPSMHPFRGRNFAGTNALPGL
jgi:hypothetical protein